MANLYGLKKSGITEVTPKSLLLGAGTVYKNLKWETSAWTGEILGATSGGNSVSIKPNILNIDIDGAVVDVKGVTIQKQGETAEMKINLVELTPECLKRAIIGTEVESEAEGFTKIDTKGNLDDDDYLDNIAFVGFRADDTPVIVIFENAICTEGLDLSGKNKENSVIPCTFKSTAGLKAGDVQDKLPVHIYIKDQG